MVAKGISTHCDRRSFIILTDVETGRLPENELTKRIDLPLRLTQEDSQ
ncbi:hypothetical protein [Nostoc sp.]